MSRGNFGVSAGQILLCYNLIAPLPDHDARAVTEALGNDALAGFFCAGEIWISAARHLMQRCDVVVIDLRQFHAGRLGTATELEMLSQLGALGKTIIIVGEATDMDAMREAIGAAHESSPLHVLKEPDRFKPYEFFAKVVQVAERRVQG